MWRVPFIIQRGKESGHSEQLRTDAEFQISGPVPDRIDRISSVQRGKVGPNVNTFPMTGGMQYIGHVPLVHVVRGPVMHPGNAIDDRAAVPAVFAGNPAP